MSNVMFDRLVVMVIDDNAHMRALLDTLLRAFGIRNIIEMADPVIALEQLKHRHVDIILVDIAMDPIDGIEFTKLLRQSRDSPNPWVPIIVVSGHADRKSVVAARDAGANEFLAKPVTAKSLFDRVASIIDNPRNFVRAKTYVGPDRRRRETDGYRGPRRRETDHQRRKKTVEELD